MRLDAVKTSHLAFRKEAVQAQPPATTDATSGVIARFCAEA